VKGTVRVEPFVRPDESSRSAALRDAVNRSLDQLLRLALEKGESQTPFAWLLDVRSALIELRSRMSERAKSGIRPNGRGAEPLRRPDVAAQIDQFVEDRWRHRVGLDGLLADVEHAVSSTAPDTAALRTRLTAWLDRQQSIQALGPELLFRLYWDDLGGEG
jgi:hypothetical protein